MTASFGLVISEGRKYDGDWGLEAEIYDCWCVLSESKPFCYCVRQLYYPSRSRDCPCPVLGQNPGLMSYWLYTTLLDINPDFLGQYIALHLIRVLHWFFGWAVASSNPTASLIRNVNTPCPKMWYCACFTSLCETLLWIASSVALGKPEHSSTFCSWKEFSGMWKGGFSTTSCISSCFLVLWGWWLVGPSLAWSGFWLLSSSRDLYKSAFKTILECPWRQRLGTNSIRYNVGCSAGDKEYGW